jgi:hypothetical protein
MVARRASFMKGHGRWPKTKGQLDAGEGKARATSANGVLRITLPTSATARAREEKIEIRGG